MSLAKYLNPRSGKTWPVDEPIWRAPDDGGYLNLSPGEGLARSDIDTGNNSLWRYRSAIRVPKHAQPVSLGEGFTPLVHGAWNDRPVDFKLDYLSPSGSFKDRGISVMLTYLQAVGVESILEDSSGNAGASVATYAAHAGMECTIVAPMDAPVPKLTQMVASGADVKLVEGTREDVAGEAMRLAEEYFYSGHAWQPFFLEGTKTVAYEIWEQRGSVPDWIIAPLGQGGNILGCFLGFQELLRRGEIDRMPRLYGIQAERCAPFVWAESGAPTDMEQKTIADGVASREPVRFETIQEALRSSEGGVIAVSEEQILRGLDRAHRKGFYVEPTCGTAFAGLSELQTKTLPPDSSGVVLLTGSGLKGTDVIRAHLRDPK